ncbi:MAG TPA: DegT/DnrJ/EryC1/StrS family aminotransferase [Aggregatilineales bacterium]|nr:DegT/DnrJ/EryC1/StrS family aminotransferase [Aggregatilineales bacterium]
MDKLALSGGEPVRSAPWPRWPIFDDADEKLLLEVFRSGNWWRHSHGQGVELAEDEANPQSMVARFQRDFAVAHGCKYGICAANGTVTMEIGLRALGIKPGDEVIVPAYTYVATATAPLMVGAIPIFADIEPDTYNIDPARIDEAITEHTRAIIPVHFGGQPCRMDEINAIARKHNLKVLEDAAHAHGSSYNGHKCGSLADMGSFSFQLSKNMTAGEGGVITTNDMEAAEMCESLVWAGRKRGQPWYSHFVLASNARMTEFQGALLLGQLRRLDEQNARRAANARVLDRLLKDIDGIEPNTTLPTTTGHSYHIYMFRYHPEAFGGMTKQTFVKALQAEGIDGAFAGYIVPLYKNPMFAEKNFFGGAWPVDAWEHGRKLDYSWFIERCPVSERACASEAVWIPQTMLLADEAAMHDIAQAVSKVQRHAAELVRV